MPPAKPKKNSKEYSFVYNNGKDPSNRDDTRMSQPPPQPHQTTPAMTINELFDKLSKRHDETDKKLDDMSEKIRDLKRAQTEFAQRLEIVERENGALSSAQAELQDSFLKLQQTTKSDINQFKSDIMEERERTKRLNNILLLGVPENDEGLVLANSIIKELLPGVNINLNNNLRIGRENTDGRVRPLRLILSNPAERNLALNNYYALEDKNHFNGIYLKKDLTKLQLSLRKLKTTDQRDNFSQPHDNRKRRREPDSSPTLPSKRTAAGCADSSQRTSQPMEN